jgi:hypothetical protein
MYFGRLFLNVTEEAHSFGNFFPSTSYVLILTKKWYLGIHFGRFFTNSSGSDVMIFKILSAKKIAKKLAFFGF